MATPILNIDDVSTNFLLKILEEATSGKELILAKNGQPVARLIPFDTAVKPKRLGLLQGKIDVDDGFNAASNDDILSQFGS